MVYGAWNAKQQWKHHCAKGARHRNRSRTWSESGWDLGPWGCSKSVRVQTREMLGGKTCDMIGDFFKFWTPAWNKPIGMSDISVDASCRTTEKTLDCCRNWIQQPSNVSSSSNFPSKLQGDPYGRGTVFIDWNFEVAFYYLMLILKWNYKFDVNKNSSTTIWFTL